MLGAAPVVALANNGGSQAPLPSGLLKNPVSSPTGKDVFGNSVGPSIPVGEPDSTPASEPAILSSDGAAQTITDGQTKLAGLANKGTTIGTNGSATYADGSAVPAPAGAVYNPDSGQYEAADGKTYSVAEFYGDEANGVVPDDEYAAVEKLFAPLKANLDASTLSSVNTIQQQYELLKSQQQQANASAEASSNRSLMLGGTRRYAPLDASGIALAKTTDGLNAIAALDAKENAAISTAQQAQQSGDMNLMLDQIKQAEDIRTQKQSTAATVTDAISKANDALATQRQQQQIDNAVASALSSGTTDSAQILSKLTGAGLSVTSDQVATSLKNFAATTGAADIKGLTGDVGNFYTLKATPGALPSSILALPPDQQLAAYIKMVNQAKSTAVPKTTAPTPDPSGSGSDGQVPLSKTGQAWVTAVLNGNATMQQVPAAIRDEVAVGLTDQPQTAYSPLAASRFSTAANRIVSNYIKLPQYELTANGLPYLQRIDAAMKNPGAVSDQDLLDSLTKLNTAGNAISDAQVAIITNGQSWADSVGVALNKLQNGGVLSDNQRQQIQKIAGAIYANYQKGYQPVYDQVTSQLKASGIPEAFWTIPDLNNLSAQIGTSDPSHPNIGSSTTLDSFLASGAPSSGNASVDWGTAMSQ